VEWNGYRIEAGADLSGAFLFGALLAAANLEAAILRDSVLIDRERRLVSLIAGPPQMYQN